MHTSVFHWIKTRGSLEGFGNCLRVHVPVLWTRSNTADVYKVIEHSNLTSEKINMRVTIYFDDMLILSHIIQKAHMSRDTVIYLLQTLGFMINIRKPI